ncbi:MAG: hypothetical protein IJI73_06180 [Kiritimatiellae bacterium]|nr:hypothetical protein [Kiritimatiellia bacterium]
MEVNFGSNSRISGSGMGYEMSFADGVGQAGKETAPANIDVSSSAVDALQRSEPTADVPASALTRDDDLGRAIAVAFSLPAPPMPAFAD